MFSFVLAKNDNFCVSLFSVFMATYFSSATYFSHLDSVCVSACGSPHMITFLTGAEQCRESIPGYATVLLKHSSYNHNEIQSPQPIGEDLPCTGPPLTDASLLYLKPSPHETMSFTNLPLRHRTCCAPFPPSASSPSPVYSPTFHVAFDELKSILQEGFPHFLQAIRSLSSSLRSGSMYHPLTRPHSHVGKQVPTFYIVAAEDTVIPYCHLIQSLNFRPTLLV